MKEPFVHIERFTFRYGQQMVLDELSWSWRKGENWVVGGQSGTGKSTFAQAAAGILQGEGVINIVFDDKSEFAKMALYVPNWYRFTNLEGDRNFYYQQRYNRHQGQDTLTVRADLKQYGLKEQLTFEHILPILETLGLYQQLDSQLIELSSGEHKKVQLVKAIWHKPQLLILDEPYTGLDNTARAALNDLLDRLVAAGMQILLITNDKSIPSAINRFAEVRGGQIHEVNNPDQFHFDSARTEKHLPGFLTNSPEEVGEPVIQLRDVTVRYGEKQILKNVSWTVRKGEKWLLQGHNGSGKSTLLSLLNGDHPQAYGHDITLFGKKRGSGESIWDIKQKIGMISPEMHWYFDNNATVWHTVASGFYDSIGWFVDVKYEEKKQIEALLDFFDLAEVKNKLLHTLPLGKQRLALLARTIIKNPPLLVLDEPCQGLDSLQTQYFNDVVDELCQHGNTLIYVGHYESQLPSCIEHKIVLKNGEVAAIENVVKAAGNK